MLKSDLKCLAVQKMVFEKFTPGKKINDFAPRSTPGRHVREDGVLYINDIRYADKYPNSYVDLWLADGIDSAERPTLIYIHGGGFIFGDKVVGDPLAMAAGRDVDFCAAVVKRGFNVVSMNYALAPEYRFPVQIEQVDQMLHYLTAQQRELGLNMHCVFLGGGSAGAILSEIYGAMLTNREYAEHLSIPISVGADQIKGLIIDEAALCVRNFSDNMNALLGCWVGADDYASSEIAQTINPVPWITQQYIPSFINSSNQEVWFLDSAQELAAALTRIGTDYELFFRGPELEKLEHGYMQKFAVNIYAQECFEHMLAFMGRQVLRSQDDY